MKLHGIDIITQTPFPGVAACACLELKPQWAPPQNNGHSYNWRKLCITDSDFFFIAVLNYYLNLLLLFNFICQYLFSFLDQNYFLWQELGLTKEAFWYITGLTVSNKYLLIWSVINFSYLSRRPSYCLPNNLLRKHVFGPRCWECRDRRSCHWSQEAHRQTSSDQNVLR